MSKLRLFPLAFGLFVLLQSWATYSFAQNRAAAISTNSEALKDYDQESEDFSPFWQEALDGVNAHLTQELELAVVAWEKKDPAQMGKAVERMSKVANAHPEQADAHFVMGMLQAELRLWDQCSQSLGKSYALSSVFKAKNKRLAAAPPRDLDYELGKCLFMAGDHSAAHEHFRRISQLGFASSHVHLALGRTLMSLGNLDEAIESFRRGMRSSSRLDTRYSLAVALDRSERFDESRAILRNALSRDPMATTLGVSDTLFSSGAELSYHRALVAITSGHNERASYYLKQYIAESSKQDGSLPWREHATRHLMTIETNTGGAYQVAQGPRALTKTARPFKLKQFTIKEDSKSDWSPCLQESLPALVFRAMWTWEAGAVRKGAPKIGIPIVAGPGSVSGTGETPRQWAKVRSCIAEKMKRVSFPTSVCTADTKCVVFREFHHPAS